MKWTLVYFDDQIANIECYKELLEDDFHVVGSNDATIYDQLIQTHRPHAFMLDVHMPVLDGHELYKRIIEHPLYNGCPVFFISGDISDENKVRSYQSGGIDFLARDLRSEELIARLSNKIKFYLQMSTVLELGNLRLDVESMTLSIGQTHQSLTLVEMRIIQILLRAFPTALTRTEVIKRIWGEESVKPGTINTHITNLKPKIEKWNHFIKIRDDQIFIDSKD